MDISLCFNSYTIYWKFHYSKVHNAKGILVNSVPNHDENFRTPDRISVFHLLQIFI